MDTSLGYNNLRNKLLVLALALILTGCVQPDAPWPPLASGGPSGDGAQPPSTLVFPPTQPPIPQTPSPGIIVASPNPLPNGAGLPTQPPTQEPASWVWQSASVGPEQVVVMFYQDAAGNRCIRYIYRSKVVARCPQAGQALATVAGSEQAADGKVYTIIAGRVLDDRVNAVSLEFKDGSSSPVQLNANGFLQVIDGVKTPALAVPVDQFGNLVGTQVPF